MKRLMMVTFSLLFMAQFSLAGYFALGNNGNPALSPPPLAEDYKIVSVFRDLNGTANYMAFGLSNPGGNGRGDKVLVIDDLTNAGQKAIADHLVRVFERGGYFRKATSNSRDRESTSWFGYSYIYRVKANDYFWYWAE